MEQYARQTHTSVDLGLRKAGATCLKLRELCFSSYACLFALPFLGVCNRFTRHFAQRSKLTSCRLQGYKQKTCYSLACRRNFRLLVVPLLGVSLRNTRAKKHTDELFEPECPICFKLLVGHATGTTPCGHLFCRSCIELALTIRSECPICLQACAAEDLK